MTGSVHLLTCTVWERVYTLAVRPNRWPDLASDVTTLPGRGA
jgi:hypothetical protein